MEWVVGIVIVLYFLWFADVLTDGALYEWYMAHLPRWLR